MKYLLLLVCFQAFNLSAFLYHGRKTPVSTFYLISLFVVIFLHMLFKLVLHFYVQDDALFEKLHGSFTFLYGPILWFYARTILSLKNSQRLILVHLIPFLITLSFNIALILLIGIGQNILPLLIRIEPIFLVGVCLSVFIYSLVTFFTLKIQVIKSSLEFWTARWVACVFLFFSFLIGLGLLSQFGSLNLGWPFRNLAYGLFLIMFFGLLILKFIQIRKPQSNINSVEESGISRYKNYQLSEDDLQGIVQKVIQHLDQTKAFKNSDYTLDDLSNELGISRLRITQALNVKLGENFYQVINRARAKESKRLLEEGEIENVSGIGLDSGFKSKSTFYKYFKEEFGLSPGDFKRNISSC